MNKILSISFLFVLAFGLIACENEEQKRNRLVNETLNLSATGDSIRNILREDMRTIQNQIGAMVDVGLEIDLLGSYVDAFKEKERKFKRWAGEWDQIKVQITSSDLTASLKDDPQMLLESGRSLNDSLMVLVDQMNAIGKQANQLLEEAKKKMPVDSLNQ